MRNDGTARSYAYNVQYEVCVRVNVNAKTPEDAVREARKLITNSALHAEVFDPRGRKSVVLEDRNESAGPARPDDQEQRLTVVVAPSFRLAQLYAREVGATLRTHKIITDPDRLRGYGRGSKIVVVQGHDPNRVLSRFSEALRLTQADVMYVDIDEIMGVERD